MKQIAPKKFVKRKPVSQKPRRPVSQKPVLGVSPEQRLQKILALAGFGSRRDCEEIIEQGRVEVNGAIATLGMKADPQKAVIKVDGERLKRHKLVYVALFKPKGVLCTHYDQQGRIRAVDLVPESLGKLFPVGRLDMDSEGLLLLTNDGALTEQLTHPRYGVPKVYRVQVAGEVTTETVQQLKKGVHLAEGFAKADDVVVKGRQKQSTILDMTLSEGMNREIRRILARLGHKVLALIRISIGSIKLGTLAPGEWRHLSTEEVARLRHPAAQAGLKIKGRRKTAKRVQKRNKPRT